MNKIQKFDRNDYKENGISKTRFPFVRAVRPFIMTKRNRIPNGVDITFMYEN